MTKHNDHLLPCPFCGDPNPNLTHDDYVHDDLRPMPVVECTKCHTWVRAEAWNNRAQLPAGGAVPDGWKLVPVEPTPEMIQAGIDTPCVETGDDSADEWEDYRSVYRAMLAAAPHPVSGEQKAVGEIVIFGSDLKEVSWSGGKMPAPGTKLYAAPPAAQEQKPDALRKRFSDIEDEILAGKHNAQSVFTAMRTAALYIGQPAAQDVSGLVDALEPFAALASLFDDGKRGGTMPRTGTIMSWPRTGSSGELVENELTVEHLKAARDALFVHRAKAQGGEK